MYSALKVAIVNLLVVNWQKWWKGENWIKHKKWAKLNNRGWKAKVAVWAKARVAVWAKLEWKIVASLSNPKFFILLEHRTESWSEWSKQVVRDKDKEPIMEYILQCYFSWGKMLERFKAEVYEW